MEKLYVSILDTCVFIYICNRKKPYKQGRAIRSILKHIAQMLLKSAITMAVVRGIIASGLVGLPAAHISVIVYVIREVFLFAVRYYQYV